MKICLTTFVQGHLYQEYLPMLIYSIGKAYPEYDVKIFLHDTLRDDLRPALDMIRSTYDRFEIQTFELFMSHGKNNSIEFPIR